MLRRLRFWHIAALLVSGFVLAGPTRAADRTIQGELAGFAKDVQKYLLAQNVRIVDVDRPPFTGSGNCTIEPRLRMTLVQELERLQIDIDKKARFLIRGQYKGLDLTDTKRLGVELTPELYDRQRDRTAFTSKAKLITDSNEVIQTLGLTGALPPAGTEEERQEKIRKMPGSQKVHLASHAVLAEAGSPYGVEILVKKGEDAYESRPPTEQDGDAFVTIDKGKVYAIRLINKADHEAAVTLTIDGLNVFSLSRLWEKDGGTTAVSYPTWMVPAGQSIVVHGWPLNVNEAAEFKVTSYGESAVAELGGDAKKAGVITALFAAAWPKGVRPPAGEGGKSVATGRGAEIDSPFKPLERNVGRVRAFVSIRYTR